MDNRYVEINENAILVTLYNRCLKHTVLSKEKNKTFRFKYLWTNSLEANR